MTRAGIGVWLRIPPAQRIWESKYVRVARVWLTRGGMGALQLLRFAVGGLWRQKVRTGLTLIGVTAGTCALAFSVALGLGLRAFIDKEFQGRDTFWRVSVRVAEPSPDPNDLPPEKVTVHGTMSEERRARIREALAQKYLNEGSRKPPK